MIQANELRVFGYIYKITNLINGKIYFGLTRVSISKRWAQHKHNSATGKKKTYLNYAIKKYSPENFKIELFKTCYTEFQLYRSEQYFIKKYNTINRNIGYNNSIGGEKSSLGKTLSPEVRKKISDRQKGRPRAPHSETAKKLMQLKAIGRDTSLAWQSSVAKRKGVPLPKWFKEKLSIAALGKGNVPVIMIKGVKEIITYKSVSIAAQETGILQSAISNVLTNRAKTAGGYKWKYALTGTELTINLEKVKV